jgi:hypothetical protein
MKDLKQLLIDRLKALGMDPALMPAFLKVLVTIISTNPDIDPAQVNQKLRSLGWNEIEIDYHSLQIAIACLEHTTN